MGNRFEHLERFLPPEPARNARAVEAEPARAPARGRRPKHRARPALVRRAIGAVAALATFGIAIAGVALGVSLAPQGGSFAHPAPSRVPVGVRLGAGSVPIEEPSQAHKKSRRNVVGAQRAPRRYRQRVRTAAAVTAPAGSGAPPVASAAVPRSDPAERKERRAPAEAPSSPAPPEPPRTPLFQCLSERGNEHFVTVDRARAGQMSAPGSGWTCSVLGQVYATDGPGRAPIELDDGLAYALERRARTEPRSELFALYRHWAGYDFFYSERVADGGLVGFVAR